MEMKQRRLWFRRFAGLLLAVLLLLGMIPLAGCGSKGQSGAQSTAAVESTADAESTAPEESAADGPAVSLSEIAAGTRSAVSGSGSEAETETSDAPDTGAADETDPEEADGNEDALTSDDSGGSGEIDEHGSYTSKEEVALYLHTYGHLPENYITKKQAEKLGWNNRAGNLQDVAPGKSIGGSRFGNYEGLLPDAKGRNYYECDINYEGGYRGPERIIYSDDGLIFYTADHYKSFEQLY